MKELLKSKTFWTGIAGILTAAGGYFTGDIEAQNAIQIAVAALASIFIRDAIAKK